MDELIHCRRCYFCGSPYQLERHHVFSGARRKASEKYNMVVYLCREHHTGGDGVHTNYDRKLELERIYQRKFEDDYGHEAFMRVFGKNYL